MVQILGLRGKIDDAYNGSHYGKKVGEGKGTTLCGVEKRLIERLQGRAMEWQVNTQGLGMAGAVLKAMARVWALHGAATADNAVQYLGPWVRNQAAVQALKSALGMKESDQRIELYKDSRTGVETCKNGVETFTIYLDLTTGKLHIDLDAAACCPAPALAADIQEYHVSVVAPVMIRPNGELTFGSPFLVHPYGRCCDLASDAYYQSLFQGLIFRSPGASQGSQTPGDKSQGAAYDKADCEELLRKIKELHESIELKQAELAALKKVEPPDNAAIDGAEGLIDDWQQAIASSIEIWDKYCDKTMLNEEMHHIIWLYSKPEDPKADEGEGSALPEEEQPQDASLVPGDSTLLPVDDVVLADQRLVKGPGFNSPESSQGSQSITFPADLAFSPGPRLALSPFTATENSFVVDPNAAPTESVVAKARTASGMQAGNGNSVGVGADLTKGYGITRLGFANSPQGGQNVTEFFTDETLYLVGQHINLNAALDIVEVKLEQTGQTVVQDDLEVQPDGSFAGAFDLRFLQPGAVKVSVRGLMLGEHSDEFGVFTHESSLFVQPR
ncbi:MAG TPA: hypothetical protein VIH59_19390 [Candidatus Tectomicrobia bacterium]